MYLCEQARKELPQYVADGEPEGALYGGLREHLGRCAACRAYVVRLRRVEGALKTYPIVSPAPEVQVHLLETISRERQGRTQEWHLFTWDLWVPVLAFGLALVIAVMSLPPQVVAPQPLPDLRTVMVAWPSPIDAWLGAAHEMTSRGQFWALWIGIFATTAGLGISLSLANWNTRHSRSLDRLEGRISAAATRLWDHGRRST